MKLQPLDDLEINPKAPNPSTVEQVLDTRPAAEIEKEVMDAEQARINKESLERSANLYLIEFKRIIDSLSNKDLRRLCLEIVNPSIGKDTLPKFTNKEGYDAAYIGLLVSQTRFALDFGRDMFKDSKPNEGIQIEYQNKESGIEYPVLEEEDKNDTTST